MSLLSIPLFFSPAPCWPSVKPVNFYKSNQTLLAKEGKKVVFELSTMGNEFLIIKSNLFFRNQYKTILWYICDHTSLAKTPSQLLPPTAASKTLWVERKKGWWYFSSHKQELLSLVKVNVTEKKVEIERKECEELLREEKKCWRGLYKSGKFVLSFTEKIKNI